jgi:hypothetical protein
VKRSNSLDSWSYNPYISRMYIISSVPDPPNRSPYISILSTYQNLVLWIKKIEFPQNGLEDIIYYEIFIKNISIGMN